VVRFVLGLAMSGIYVVVESWLNSVATNRTRGRLLSIYLVVSNVSFGAGQLLFVATDAGSATPFLVGSAICSLSVLPLSLTATPAPRHETTHRGLPIRAVLRAAPLAPATSAMSGFGISVIVSLGAVYGARTGMTDSEIGVFLAVGSIGGILLQWPIGDLSDRFPRRLVILFTNVGAAAVAGAAGGAGDGSVLIFVALGLYTAISYPLYSLAMSHLNDVIEPELRTASAGVLILAYGVGSVTGPFLASLLMDWEAVGFWVSLAASNLIITPYLVYRIVTRRRENKWKHVPFGAETTPNPGMFVNVDDEPVGTPDRSTVDTQPSPRNPH
jgi:MFS family permease